MPSVGPVDRFQREHTSVGFPLAVIYKYFDDQGNYLAATMTYYAFIAIFPLMLLGTSILGFVLAGRPEWQEVILDSALSQFPIIGDEIGRPQGLQGSVGGIVFGSLAALYGSMGLGQSLQNTAWLVWSVPRNSRPNPVQSRLKTLVLLLTAGTSLLVVSVFSTVVARTDWLTRWLGGGLKFFLPIAITLIVGTMLTLLFRFAAAGRPPFLQTMPGGFALAIMWQLLQYVGALYVEHVLVGAASMNRTFGLVLGLVGFLWLGAVMAVLAMEINVVLTKQLWPRALLTPFTDRVELTEADMRAYQGYAQMQRHKGFQEVSVRFEKFVEAAERERSGGDS
ncbi:MAG: YihY/virulence factor BrkB family protein [Nocardioides sp.]|jgi:membrane protein